MTEKMKTCNDCKLEYPETREFFHYQNKKKNRFVSYCIACKRKRNTITHKNYYLKNREKVLQRTAEYRKDNPELVKKRHQKYYQKNKEQILEHQKYRRSLPEVKKMNCEREKKRRNENPSYKIQTNVSRMVRLYLNKNGATKKSRLWSALPYTPQELREHLESQFEDWMTWDNYGTGEGKWNIDHIYPQSLLPYDSLEHPNFLKCWELNNLRPLCSLENTSKGNNLDFL